MWLADENSVQKSQSSAFPDIADSLIKMPEVLPTEPKDVDTFDNP